MQVDYSYTQIACVQGMFERDALVCTWEGMLPKTGQQRQHSGMLPLLSSAGLPPISNIHPAERLRGHVYRSLHLLHGRHLFASGECRENAEGGKGGTDEQGRVEAIDKHLLQCIDTGWGKALRLLR